ncbi:hypothetical protein VNO77_40588 [Canavalia gladiata]|uniref:Uncharacterized protein n=1 Tax=Canavalia gladiata TaxID=3824 RepID=A0AAN9JZZ7_CANGL
MAYRTGFCVKRCLIVCVDPAWIGFRYQSFIGCTSLFKCQGFSGLACAIHEMCNTVTINKSLLPHQKKSYK